jgi:hypothetical protein
MVIKVETPGLELDAAMRLLLTEAMAQYPSQSANPKYDGSDYPDDYCKVSGSSFRDSPICYSLSLELVVTSQ